MGLALAFANILMNGIIMNHIGAFGGTLIGFNVIQASTLSACNANTMGYSLMDLINDK